MHLHSAKLASNSSNDSGPLGPFRGSAISFGERVKKALKFRAAKKCHLYSVFKRGVRGGLWGKVQTWMATKTKPQHTIGNNLGPSTMLEFQERHGLKRLGFKVKGFRFDCTKGSSCISTLNPSADQWSVGTLPNMAKHWSADVT